MELQGDIALSVLAGFDVKLRFDWPHSSLADRQQLADFRPNSLPQPNLPSLAPGKNWNGVGNSLVFH